MSLKDKWIDALRSGKYKQGKGALRCGNNFCCLGVLADLCGEYGNGAWSYEHGKNVFVYGNKRRSGIFWPKDFGADGPDTATATQTLAGMNDSGYTFGEIADWIEENITNEMLGE